MAILGEKYKLYNNKIIGPTDEFTFETQEQARVMFELLHNVKETTYQSGYEAGRSSMARDVRKLIKIN